MGSKSVRCNGKDEKESSSSLLHLHLSGRTERDKNEKNITPKGLLVDISNRDLHVSE
jgi:hypothetical protein